VVQLSGQFRRRGRDRFLRSLRRNPWLGAVADRQHRSRHLPGRGCLPQFLLLLSAKLRGRRRTALLTTFADVPASHWSWPFVEALVASGLTGGCGQDDYCPDLLLKRAESAVFLVKASHGPGFVPPPATGTVFNDIPAGFWAARWIERLAAEGVTTGCGDGNYCPDRAVNRAEMAVFLTRMFNLPLP
jgi:hypothetical protein